MAHKLGMRWPFTRSAPLETRDEDLSDEYGVLAALWSGASAGTVAISGAEALRIPAVANAVRVISEAAATLDLRVMEIGADGVETEDRTHPIGVMLRGDVNGWTSGFDLIRDLTADALTRDWGGLAYVNRIRGEMREIVRYQPAAISVTYDPWTGEPTYRIEGQIIPSANVLHVRGPFDRSPLSLAAEAIGVAREMERHAGNLFKRGAKPGGLLKTSKSVGDKGVKRMIAAWRAAHEGSDNAGKTAILYDGAEWQQLALTSVDSQFLELRKFQVIEIARAFRVPPSMLYELDRATWSNSEQMGREFLTFTLEPWLRALETALGRALFSREERARYRFSFDRDDLTRADMIGRSQAISSLIASRVINPNEGRNWLGLGPRDGGEEYANPNTGSNQPGAAAPQEPKANDA
ncbi:phage portal protein [Consotaella salsifontis]|uniref:Phage portal protein, HK97 family n=1 Tax=Consotaella salsifontis TaxID=1365950 RepID=A0A1T4SE15_9HYPH|nr:phage portal protein [Consotaella salsifontis]SKA26407.1 phage portal protein, HK97 family [Consotaella salsifontis]